MNLKKVISNELLKEKMDEAIALLCNTVKITLGPKGNNVIIDHSNFSPFITNDGVTIAQNIESDDKEINTILELAKEASIKTNETVGDGTTSTLVLLEAIYKEGRTFLEKGISPIILQKELEIALEDTQNKIKSKSHIPNKKELKNIATISANSEKIGNLVSEAFFKVKNKNAIRIVENDYSTSFVTYLNGYILNAQVVSDYYFKEESEINLQNVQLLLSNVILEDINCIANIINNIIDKDQSLIIIAPDYSDSFINESLSLYMNEKIKIILLRNPEYGKNQYAILKDLQIISRAKIIKNNTAIFSNQLGILKQVKMNKETITISFEKDETIQNYLKELKNDKEDDLEFKEKRIAMFDKGLATIFVGAQTITERRELKMRYDDALCAISSASYGVIPGAGLTYLAISDLLQDTNTGYSILKNALQIPFKQILLNAGLNVEQIHKTIQNANYTKIYNVLLDSFEDIKDTLVLDATEVIISALKNACSIAIMLLSTSSLVINEYQNNFQKINDYNEL